MCIHRSTQGIHKVYTRSTQGLHSKPLFVLRKAEKGDLTDSILCIRKAGEAYAKNFTKDSLVGLKNPIRRSRTPLQVEAIVETIGSELAKVANEALAAYAVAASDLEDLGMKAQSQWITGNVTGGINELLTAGGKVLPVLCELTRGLAREENELADALSRRFSGASLPAILASVPRQHSIEKWLSLGVQQVR